ncbi:MAG: hypothetical protein Q9216_001763 [Gyalolechia sp. 2 TL-2023]
MKITAGLLDIADPSDWLKSTVPKLAPVESALRCQVCKDFFDTPMITSCSHTFCSLCIRRCLTNDGKCPACRAPDQELRLRRNWALQELVDAFQLARPSLTSLTICQVEQLKARKPRGKRKLDDTDLEDTDSDRKVVVGRRKTRSQNQQQAQSPKAASLQSIEDDSQAASYVVKGSDGLAACPICFQRMKEEAVFLHLDTHNEPTESKRSEPGRYGRSSSIEIVGGSRVKNKAAERLPQINYSLMKDNALRKKLSDLGIPNTGARALLIRRHAEWVNIVNANADSSKPKSKREMLRELDIWDRSTGRSIANGGPDSNSLGSIMSKDFDGAAWSVNHQMDFEDLVSEARRTGRVSNNQGRKQKADQKPRQMEHENAGVSTNYESTTNSVPDQDTSATSSTTDAKA